LDSGKLAGVAIETRLQCGLLPGGNNDFTERVPGSAIVALSLPFAEVGAAFVADISGFAFSHDTSSLPWRSFL
jgi:hypothetical protein